jgi:TPR repeat protein
MKRKFLHLIILLAFFSIGGILIMYISNTNRLSAQERGMIINTGTELSEEEILHKTLIALKGVPEVAYRIAIHFLLGPRVRDRDKSYEWYVIAIENGHLEAQLGFALMMLNRKNDIELYNRGIFWLYELAKIDYRDTEAQLIRLGYTLDSASSPDDSHFLIDYAQLSEPVLSDYRIGALQGNRRAAFMLGKYFGEIVADNELSEYWFRIGAQNGCPESMYSLGQIMIGKDEELDQVRGRFWLDRAGWLQP